MMMVMAGARTSGFPKANRQSGTANRRQGLRPKLAYLTSPRPTDEPRNA